jgi:hypothetical protein
VLGKGLTLGLVGTDQDTKDALSSGDAGGSRVRRLRRREASALQRRRWSHFFDDMKRKANDRGQRGMEPQAAPAAPWPRSAGTWSCSRRAQVFNETRNPA